MRGTDAADPRLVRRDRARAPRPPRGGHAAAGARRARRPARTRRSRRRVAAPCAGTRRGRRRRRRGPRPLVRGAPPRARPPARPAGRRAAEPELDARRPDSRDAAPAPASGPAAPVRPTVDIDDVIVAWAEILPGLPPATPCRGARGAAARGRRRRHHLRRPARRTTTSRCRASRRKPTTSAPRCRDSSAARCSSSRCRTTASTPIPVDVSAAPLDEEPPDDDELDLADLVDDATEAPAVDSVTLITQSLGATVVEEVPRDRLTTARDETRHMWRRARVADLRCRAAAEAR